MRRLTERPAARLREAGVSTLMVDTEQGATDNTCLHLADLPANTPTLAIRLSLSGWRAGATP